MKCTKHNILNNVIFCTNTKIDTEQLKNYLKHNKL